MRITTVLFFISVFFFQTGCVTVYKPSAINSPDLYARHQFRGSAGLGLAGVGVLNLQGAYSINRKVGVTGSVMVHSKNSEYQAPKSLGLGRHNQYYADGGAGYFKCIDRMKRYYIQGYGGAGLGYSDNYFSQPDAAHIKLQCTYHNLYVQPGIYYTNKYYDAAFDLRATYLNIFGIHASSFLYNQQSFYFLTAEPTITLRVGSKGFRIFMQTGYTLPLMDTKNYYALNTDATKRTQSLIKFSLGFNITFTKNMRNSQKWLKWKN
ncbi:hypothetical protein LBMAG27_08760 [Bacteroidota bacterium]|nr:hypothetical protein LBMAG27_08760 [Bacteroidota bacterium]